VSINIGVNPAPFFAVAVTAGVASAGGAVALIPVANDHFAAWKVLQTPEGAVYALTVRLAEAVLVVSNVPTYRWPDVLVNGEPVLDGAEMVTLITQVPVGDRVILLADIVPEPAVAVTAGVPQLVVVTAGVLATTSVPGNVSEKFTFEMETASGFVMVNVNVDVPPAVVVDGLKLLEKFKSVGLTRLIVRADVA